MSDEKKINCKLTEKYRIIENIKTKYGYLSIAGFIEFKHYGSDEYMMLPYLEYDNKKYIFMEEEDVNGVHFIVEINEKESY